MLFAITTISFACSNKANKNLKYEGFTKYGKRKFSLNKIEADFLKNKGGYKIKELKNKDEFETTVFFKTQNGIFDDIIDGYKIAESNDDQNTKLTYECERKGTLKECNKDRRHTFIKNSENVLEYKPKMNIKEQEKEMQNESFWEKYVSYNFQNTNESEDEKDIYNKDIVSKLMTDIAIRYDYKTRNSFVGWLRKFVPTNTKYEFYGGAALTAGSLLALIFTGGVPLIIPAAIGGLLMYDAKKREKLKHIYNTTDDLHREALRVCNLIT
ncbi:MAG: hypothetical protein GY830_05065 [Bacteroidetes bacterium]|nr:hypothetical protein [Bacteroidota bacterium]